MDLYSHIKSENSNSGIGKIECLDFLCDIQISSQILTQILNSNENNHEVMKILSMLDS